LADIILSMNLGFGEMVFIFLLALLIFGPRKLPEIGRQLGRSLAEFKRASNEFRSQIEDEVRQLEAEESASKPPEPASEEGPIGPPLTPPAGTMAIEPAPPKRSAGEHDA
jgi:TatA/E family protein of Tat protein translocase